MRTYTYTYMYTSRTSHGCIRDAPLLCCSWSHEELCLKQRAKGVYCCNLHSVRYPHIGRMGVLCRNSVRMKTDAHTYAHTHAQMHAHANMQTSTCCPGAPFWTPVKSYLDAIYQSIGRSSNIQSRTREVPIAEQLRTIVGVAFEEFDSLYLQSVAFCCSASPSSSSPSHQLLSSRRPSFDA